MVTYTMSITLNQIQELSQEQVHRILQSQKCSLTGNLNGDRAMVMLLYHRNGLLNEDFAPFWIIHPSYMDMMLATQTLNAGLTALRGPFNTKVVVLYRVFHTMRLYGPTGDAILPLKLVEYYILPHQAVVDLGPIYSALRTSTDTAATVSRINATNAFAAVAIAAWKTLINHDAQIHAIAPVEHDICRNPYRVMSLMLDVKIQVMLPIARYYYLWSLCELLTYLPPLPEWQALNKRLALMCSQYGCADIFASSQREAVMARLLDL